MKQNSSSGEIVTASEKAHALRNAIPRDGLFKDKFWRIAPDPLPLPENLYEQILESGSRLHAFHKACNLLYRQSVEGKQPEWIHRYLDAGKSPSMIQLAREKSWKNDLPCVIRPDFLLTDGGLVLTELDSVPGGIGLTAWMQKAHASIADCRLPIADSGKEAVCDSMIESGMLQGFIAALSSALSTQHSALSHAAIVISEEAKDYRPEMEWLVEENAKCKKHHSRESGNPESKIQNSKLMVCPPQDLEYRSEGVFLHGERVDVIYRFFELFDLANISNIEKMISAAREGLVRVTPPFKPQLEEKLWLALFWFPQLAEFWRRELGDRYFHDLQKIIPFTWILDPAPLPPHAVIPRLDIHDWNQIVDFSQKQRDLILKISGFSERAWGSRGVFLGSDMPAEEWKSEVSRALAEFDTHPHILQRFAHTTLIEHSYYDFEQEKLVPLKGRLRLCPYYFVENDKAKLGGVLATLCPADKKFIHGMEDAIMTLAQPTM